MPGATYQELSAKIAQLAGRDDEKAQESLNILLMRRAELLNNTANKIVELSKIIAPIGYLQIVVVGGMGDKWCATDLPVDFFCMDIK